MEEIERGSKSRLNVEFYPIRNRYIENKIRSIYRMLLMILLLNITIGAIVFVDFSDYSFQDLKEFFANSKISRLFNSQTSGSIVSTPSVALSSMYAGHSAPSTTPAGMHNRQSHHVAFQETEQDTQNVRQTGFYGIDVSHWQQNIDWERVAQDTIPHKLSFAIIKATQGAGQTDPNFTKNWNSANDNFEMVGAYHFYTYQDDPEAQFGNFRNTVSLEPGDLPPILDIELNCSDCDSIGVSKTEMVNDLKQFISSIETHYSLKPLLYTNEDFYNEYLRGNFDEYNYWIAKYERTPPAGMAGFLSEVEDTTGTPSVVMWQFSNYERIKGIIGRVDMNFLPASARESIGFMK